MPIGTSLAPYLPLVEGQEVGGTIVAFRVQQKSDYDTNRPLYFERTADGKGAKGFAPYDADGKPNKPICDWVFTLDVGEEDENGDTERRIFLDPRKGKKGTAVEGKRALDAIEIALKKAGAHRVGLEIGGNIYITRGPKVVPKRGDAACITYTARYEPPEGGPGISTPVDETIHLIGGGTWPTPEGMIAEANPAARIPAYAPSAAAFGGQGGSVTQPREDDEPPF